MASQLLASYSPEDMTIILANSQFTHTITGYADGTFANIVREMPASVLYVGADLSNARVVRSNHASTITLTLHQASSSNDVLSQLLLNDEDTRDDTWLFSVTIKDCIGRSLYYSPQAFITTNPDAAYSTGIETRDWGIQCVNLTNYQGGNAAMDPDTVGTIEDIGGEVQDRWRSV